jgi:hypothetical protein
MKGGVEAGDCRDARHELADRSHGGQGCGEVEGREVRDGDQVADDLRVDAHRFRVALPPVHHAVAHRLDAAHRVDGRVEPSALDLPADGLELLLAAHLVLGADHADLQ